MLLTFLRKKSSGADNIIVEFYLAFEERIIAVQHNFHYIRMLWKKEGWRKEGWRKEGWRMAR